MYVEVWLLWTAAYILIGWGCAVTQASISNVDFELRYGYPPKWWMTFIGMAFVMFIWPLVFVRVKGK